MNSSQQRQAVAPRYTADRKAMCRRDGGVFVLHLQGTEREMARQHGELLAPEIRLGVLPFMARFLELHLNKQSTWMTKWTNLLKRTLVHQLAAAIARNMAPTERKAFHALGAAASIKPDVVDRALGTPDALLYLLGRLENLTGLGEHLRGRLGMGGRFGCCGGIALPDATADGHLLHGRNMDYDGIGFLDRFPTVAFCKPKHGQPFVWIASAGVHTAGLTAMNASGLFLGANTAPTTDVSLGGLSLFSLNDRVIRQARTLAEAIELYAALKPATGYNIHLSHGPSGTAAVVEFSAGRQAVRKPQDDLLVATNHYETPALAQTAPLSTIVDDANTRARRKRLSQRLENARPVLTVETLINALRDLREPDSGELHPLGDVVCNYFNVSSVAADVTAKHVFVGAQSAPTALGRYVDFDFDAEMEAFLSPRTYPMHTISPSPERDSEIGDVMQKYIAAHVELVHRGRPQTALIHLKEALRIRADEPRALLSAGLLALAVDRRAECCGFATRYLAVTAVTDVRRHRAHLLQAWCADLDNDPPRAAKHYAAAAQCVARAKDHSATAEMRRFGRRFTRRDQKKMDIDLFNGKNLPL